MCRPTSGAIRTAWRTFGHLDELVVKEVHRAGSYGMQFGPITFLERADNTAWMLDVKFHGAPAAGEVVASAHSAEATRDFYH